MDCDEKDDHCRSFFASGVINAMIYVAGGNNSDLFGLSSAEGLGSKKRLWTPVASMRINIAVHYVSVLNEKLLVTEGCFWPFHLIP